MKFKITPLVSEILLVLFSFIIFFLVRTAILNSVPVYLDEAIYINWAHLFGIDKNFAYFSMQDGKTPLFFWIVSLFLNFIKDPLIAGRLVSVIAGAGTMFSSWLIARKLFGKKIAAVIFPLYIFIPYAQLIERTASADSLQVFLGTLAIAITIILTEVKSEINLTFSFLGAFFTGILLGTNYLVKSSAKIYLIIIILIIVAKIITSIKKPKKILHLLLFGLLVWFPYSEIFNAFRTGASRFFLDIAFKERLLTFSIQEIIRNPFNVIYQKNLPFFLSYIVTYIGIPLAAIIIFSIIKIIKKKEINGIIIFLIPLIISTGIFFSAKDVASRYFFPIIPFLVIIGAKGLWELYLLIKNKLVFWTIILILAIPWLIFNYKIIFSPYNPILAPQDRNYLFGNELSGVGVEETINTITAALAEKNVILVVDSFWGQPDYIKLKIEGQKTKYTFNLRKEPLFKQVPDELRKATADNRVFIFFVSQKNDIPFFIDEDKIKLVKDFPRLSDKKGQVSHARLFEILP